MLRLQKCHFFVNSAAAVISVICTCGMSKIGEMVSSENEWGANSERSNHFQLCGAGFCVAQLVPVTPDWSVSPCTRTVLGVCRECAHRQRHSRAAAARVALLIKV